MNMLLCESIMFFFDQKVLDNSLFMSSLAIHLFMLENCLAINLNLFFCYVL